MTEIKDLIHSINQFRDDRNWRQYHNPKDLAISISIEAAELLEDFQWKSNEEALEANEENIKEEIADILIYSIMFCSDLNLNVKEIIEEKLMKNGQKYPIEK
ncbi:MULTISPECIES: nucleotide pyrophosphohydrolase [Bacillus]|uniref:nucleotide pyrophosphohydrolase n=1 Tax=Bacillus TaxID=1386 RepID=UPI000BA595A2|nr:MULTISPECIES: nucleotide pyrophosphohydrolase [Bacillus]MBR0622629.1 nucleotide pyrophosphohydrolase [Bacillus pumilus]MBU5258404.1 nucleotide pyrophosphohydrolase [Bacillus pumilus]MCW6698843.1 nucleotide pyrophosphohydrolase [Bacillus sp. RP12]MDQ0819009.1 NTP pyrophosphatase (non-canonical NTP hydrolase) [Bacillus pumilus]PAC80560.1 nucleotide pyrophosphohydrolase [Bacillus sp. 7788]